MNMVSSPTRESYYQRFPDLAAVVDAAFESRHNKVTRARPGHSNDQDGVSTVTSPDPMATGIGDIAAGRI